MLKPNNLTESAYENQNLINVDAFSGFVKGNIDAAAGFDQYSIGKNALTSQQITNKEIRLAIPKATNKAQCEQLNKAVDYGKRQGVNLIITEVNNGFY